ncbi:hypothetical protein DI396_05025 [Litorivita pollutaquae]|uniref:Uncharacterized protein n=1 Tax=Litorivita pollutaquae TaxID=2200892 RepID=A0A2V4MNQ1_9RHOB|nr:DUF6477 family protein [Litorivita pollutaquae]PYC48355.1 hypothetical protein DI396_05025 [Litorivita pollutaquae]
MQDILGMLTTLRRPRLLIRAARIGMEDYRRDHHLRRLLGHGALPRSGAALLRLMEMEADLNDLRRQSNASYSVINHVDLLIAMMAEAQILRNTAG